METRTQSPLNQVEPPFGHPHELPGTFVTAQPWKQHKCPLGKARLNKAWDSHSRDLMQPLERRSGTLSTDVERFPRHGGKKVNCLIICTV